MIEIGECNVELWHPVTTKEKVASLLRTTAHLPCRVATLNLAGKMTRLEYIGPRSRYPQW